VVGLLQSECCPRGAQLRSGLFTGGRASTKPDLLAEAACKTYSGYAGYLSSSPWWDCICARIPYLGAGVRWEWENGPRDAVGYP
jgi:hypothetical protein